MRLKAKSYARSARSVRVRVRRARCDRLKLARNLLSDPIRQSFLDSTSNQISYHGDAGDQLIDCEDSRLGEEN